MDAHLDTLSTELYKVNVRVGRITRRQVLPIPRMMMMMMLMTMTLQMMMAMIALPMRYLLDTLPFVTRDKKGE